MNDKQKEECILNFKIQNEKVDSIAKRVDSLETKYNDMIKISTLLELQIESNKEQDKFLRQQFETLIKVNENLTSLNNVTKGIEKRLSTVESDLQQQKDNLNQQKVDNIKDKSINVIDLIKNIIIGGLVLYVFITLGIK